MTHERLLQEWLERWNPRLDASSRGCTWSTSRFARWSQVTTMSSSPLAMP
jgi:hypothetical protein